MTGESGDADFTNYVTLDGNETITGSKTFDVTSTQTFDGTAVFNNAVTLNSATSNAGTITNETTGTINNSGVIYSDASAFITSDGTTNIGGTLNLTTDILGDKPLLIFSNTADTSIASTGYLELTASSGNRVAVLSDTGFSVAIQSTPSTQRLTANETDFAVDPTTTQTFKIGGSTRQLVSASTTTLTNATISLQDSTPTTRFLQNNGQTTITNATITELATTAYKVQNVDGTDKLNIAPTLTTMNNTTVDIQAGGVSKFNATSSITAIDNPTQMRLKINTTTKILMDSANTQINNDNLSLLTSSVTKYSQNSSETTLKNTTINLQDATPTTRFTQTNGTTTITNTNIGTNGILTQTGSATLKGTTITLQDATPTTHFLQNSTATTLTNTTINLQDATPTTRFTQTNGATTLTNTAIALTGSTGALALTTTTGKASMSSTTGLIELKTGAGGTTGINIENSSTTTGGITLKTNGTTGSIALISQNDINITTNNSAGDIWIQSQSTNSTLACLLEAVMGGVTIKGSSGNSIYLNDGTTDRLTQSTSATTLRNTTISLTDNTPTTRFTQNNGTTTITNGNIYLVGNVYASSYNLGTTPAAPPFITNLFSFQVHGTKQGGDANGTCILSPMYDTTTNRCFNYCMPCHVVFTKVTIMYDIDSSTSTTMSFKFIKKTSNAGAETTVGYSDGFATTVNSTTSYTQVVSLISPTLLIGAEYSVDDIMKVEYASSPSNEWGIVFHGYQLP